MLSDLLEFRNEITAWKHTDECIRFAQLYNDCHYTACNVWA